MSNNEDEFSSNPGFLKYKIEQLEKLVHPLIDMVNDLDKKLEILVQKIILVTAIIGVAFQAFGLWYSNRNESQYTEDEKKIYYEMRVQDSDTVRRLKEEIANLKKANP